MASKPWMKPRNRIRWVTLHIQSTPKSKWGPKVPKGLENNRNLCFIGISDACMFGEHKQDFFIIVKDPSNIRLTWLAASRPINIKFLAQRTAEWTTFSISLLLLPTAYANFPTIDNGPHFQFLFLPWSTTHTNFCVVNTGVVWTRTAEFLVLAACYWFKID